MTFPATAKNTACSCVSCLWHIIFIIAGQHWLFRPYYHQCGAEEIEIIIYCLSIYHSLVSFFCSLLLHRLPQRSEGSVPTKNRNTGDLETEEFGSVHFCISVLSSSQLIKRFKESSNNLPLHKPSWATIQTSVHYNCMHFHIITYRGHLLICLAQSI